MRRPSARILLGLGLVLGSAAWLVLRIRGAFDAGRSAGRMLEPGEIETLIRQALALPLAVGAVGIAAITVPARARRVIAERGLPPYRLALVVIGFAAVVYGTASLTGRWLGEPPWMTTTANIGRSSWTVVRSGWEWISGGVVALGLGLVVVGAWPRRPRVGSSL